MNRFTRFITTAVAVAGIVVPAASALAQKDGKPTVAIMFFNNNAYGAGARDYDGLSKGIADFLITEMAANPGIRVVERDQVQKLIDEQKLVTNGIVDRESAVRVGKLLGAQHMIFGGFMADPKGNVRIDARAVDVGTSAIEYTERVQDKADNIMTLIGALAAKMNKGMLLPAMPARTGDVGAPVAAPAGAQLAGAPATPTKLPMRYAVMYGKALDLADRGDKTHAVELFSAVLKEFPDFTPAQSAKSKLAPGT
ncbi:MAG: CsgG/HfaB family protein [Gemmatimonadaceae bacterium]